MPFDLTATTHTFTKTDIGDVETVVVNDPTDARNVALVRSHLTKEASYADPAKIHGMDMPGLQSCKPGPPE
jgi:hypothetical protein